MKKLCFTVLRYPTINKYSRLACAARYGVAGGVRLEDNDDPVEAGGRGNGENSYCRSTLRDTGTREFENASRNTAIDS